MLHEQSKVDGCDNCEGKKQNPPDFLKRQICPNCAHHAVINNRGLFKLLHYFKLQDAGCPVERHELLDEEWLALGQIKTAWGSLEIQWHKDHPQKE